jgi:hypothetical protein
MVHRLGTHDGTADRVVPRGPELLEVGIRRAEDAWSVRQDHEDRTRAEGRVAHQRKPIRLQGHALLPCPWGRSALCGAAAESSNVIHDPEPGIIYESRLCVSGSVLFEPNSRHLLR